ncbi:PHP domain-containing protein, partial [Nocardia sp. 2YAB30]|uniref:PHP domain-containing protein n=1 Tax=Nocardia sp. 2YAB30 TaxID=3233022 RepID=UPI003F97CC5B
MGWGNGPPSWAEMERVLSGRPGRADPDARYPGDGGDSPAWSRKRVEYRPEPVERADEPSVPYAELHAHSAYSFLDGASQPEELVEEAVRLGLEAIALTDHDGFYGTVRFAEAAKEWGMPTVFGAELSLGVQPEPRGPAMERGHATADSAARTGSPDPAGPHLLVLARGQEGYRRLSRAIAAAHLAAGEKGILRYDLDELTAAAEGHWHILTGCRKGHLRQALERDLHTGSTRLVHAEAALRDLTERFGTERVSVELTHHGIPEDDERNAHLLALADRLGLPVLASTGAHFAAPGQRRRAMALAAIRARQSLDEVAGWLAPAGGAHLRSGAEMARLFADCPHAVANAAALARECAFDLKLIAPKLPPFDVPSGHDEQSWLRELTLAGAARRYGHPKLNPEAYEQIEHELAVINALEFPGYFLVVHDIVSFCKDNDILCQGRGSAANSAVCYAIGITNVDPVRNQLLFERFLSPERDGPPDIDVDIESDRREEAIQHVYARYGREYAAQVANVITYRGKSAVRDAARALGFSPGQQDAWSKQVSRWGGVESAALPGPSVVTQATASEPVARAGVESAALPGPSVVTQATASEPVARAGVESAALPGPSVVTQATAA